MYYQTSLFILLHLLMTHGTVSAAAQKVELSLHADNEKTLRSSVPITPPSKPVTLHINLTAINITWTHTQTTPSTQYIIQVFSQSYNDTKFHNLTTLINTTYYIYNGLVYGMFYQFRVLAYTNGQLSDPSQPSIIFDNGLTAPPGPPQDLQLHSLLTNNQLEVLMTWTQPEPVNELKYLYLVYMGTNEHDLQLVDSLLENTQHTFKNLQPFTEYYFSVQADYGGERSILAPVVSTMYFNPTLLPPVTILSSLPNYTMVTLNWSHPDIPHDILNVTTFTILYTPVIAQSNNNYNYSKTVSSLQLSTTVTDLEQGTQYAFMVRYSVVIKGTYYNSNVSNVQNTTTLSSLTCLSCYGISPTQIALSWQVLNAINKTLVYSVNIDDSMQVINFTTWKSKGVFVISHLHPWSSYRFSIEQKGLNGVQFSACPLNGCRTDEDAPSGYPTDVHATPINTTAVNISWSHVPKNQQNGIIEIYIIGCLYCPSAQYATGDLYYIVNGLLPNSEYVFVIAAQNGKGFGPDSPLVTVKTKAESSTSVDILQPVMVTPNAYSTLSATSSPLLVCVHEELTDSPKNIIVEYTTDDYVMLSWQPPVSTNRNSNITLYTITYKEADTLNEASGDQDTLNTRLNCSINTTSTIAKLTNLLPNTMYIAWISAWTNVGQGPLALPVTFRTIIDCPSCTLNISVDIVNPSNKCFAVNIHWIVYGGYNIVVLYYNVTILSPSNNEVAFNKKLEDTNVTTFQLTSDSLHSRTNFNVILEAHLLLDDSQYSLQRVSSIKTPSCTGVTTVVAVVISSVCIVSAILSVGASLLIFQKCKNRNKNTTNSSSPVASLMSRRVVVNNDYLSSMKQLRGDGHSTTNTVGSLSTGDNSTHFSPVPSLTDEDDNDTDSFNEQDPLLSSQGGPPVFFSPVHSLPFPSVRSSQFFERLGDVDRQLTDDGYLAENYLVPVVLVRPNDVPDERPAPEGSSLSSISLDSFKN